MPLPQNAKDIYSFLTGQGLSANAAAGILGNIFGESGGNPESQGSGGNGLIGWTPPLSGAVTGNVQKDLAFQEAALMTFIKKNSSISAINNNSSSPTAAASYFIYNLERPANPAGDLPIRAQVASDVAAAAKSGNWPQGTAATNASIGSDVASSILGTLLGGLGFSGDMSDMLERGALILLGATLLVIGIWRLDAGKAGNPLKQSNKAKKESLGVANKEATGAQSDADDVAEAAENG